MASCSKSKPNSYSNNRGYYWYLRFFCFTWFLVLRQTSLFADDYFSRLYTNNAKASTCYYTIPHGSSGDFIVGGTAIDSAAGVQGLYFSRLDKSGKIKHRTFFSMPNPSRSLMTPSVNASTRINDNRYVVAGSIDSADCCKYGFLIELDSNCTVTRFLEVKMPFCGSYDSFMYTADVKYDPSGSLIVLNHVICGFDEISPVLIKFDTSYNLIWSKIYSPGDYRSKAVGGLFVENDGYTYFGRSSKFYSDDKNYKCQSIIAKVDTAGNELWTYASKPTEIRSSVYKAVRTSDGGYIYIADGHAFNEFPSTAPYQSLLAKNLLVKLDAGRNIVWEKEIDKWFSPYGPTTSGIFELPDRNIVVGRYDTDSSGKNDYNSYPSFQKFAKDGTLIWRRRYEIIKEGATTNPMVDLNSWSRFENGDLLMGMAFLHTDPLIKGVIQKSWLIKVDSNGCFGPGDTACASVAVPELPQSNIALDIYPNPSTDKFTIKGRLANPAVFEVSTIGGQVILIQTLPSDGFEQVISSDNWASGLYFYRLASENEPAVYGKLIKK